MYDQASTSRPHARLPGFWAEQTGALKEAAHQGIVVRRAAEALAFELRLLLRQLRDLARVVADSWREIGRRYVNLG